MSAYAASATLFEPGSDTTSPGNNAWAAPDRQKGTVRWELEQMAEASPALARACALNPFTQAVELVRFSLYLTPNWPALGWTLLATAVFAAAALYGYDPARGFTRAKG